MVEIEIIQEVAGMKIGTKKTIPKRLAFDLINRGIAKEVGKSASKTVNKSKPKTATKKAPCKDCEDEPCEDCEKAAKTTNIPDKK